MTRGSELQAGLAQSPLSVSPSPSAWLMVCQWLPDRMDWVVVCRSLGEQEGGKCTPLFLPPPFSLSHSSFSLFLCNFSLCLARCSSSSNHFIVILHSIVCHELTHLLNKMYSDILLTLYFDTGTLVFTLEDQGWSSKTAVTQQVRGPP